MMRLLVLEGRETKYYVSALCGGSPRHPSCVAAIHHSFTEINLYRSHILQNIRSIYVHIRQRDVQAMMCLLPSFCTLEKS